jgi:uncharacterized membrane protein (UPF0127 family)
MEILDKSRIVIFSGDQTVADNVTYCSSHGSRRDGLLGRALLAENEGILMEIPKSRQGKSGLINSIHMLGMRFPIAAAWLDQEGSIVHSVLAKKWRPYYGTSKASWFILELHSSRLPLLPLGAKLGWKLFSTDNGC